MNTKTISARIPESLFLKIQESDKGTTDCVIAGLELLFSNTENTQQEPDSNLHNIDIVLQEKERIIDFLEDHNKVLQMELARANNRADDMYMKLLGAPGEQIKKWWQVWK